MDVNVSQFVLPLQGKKILLGVTGSIAAYKAVELLRQFKALGADVTVVMTRAAREFVAPLTFQVLSNNTVYDDLFHCQEGVGHIRLGEENDLLLIAPATANSLAKFAQGISDDLLSAIILSTDKPVLVAPAMDGMMWENPMTQRNIQILKDAGFGFIGPEFGKLASGSEGLGRLSEIQKITVAVSEHFKVDQCLKGEIILVSSGPTRESIDPVRFLSNRSSGKMGYAIAKVARNWGATVYLISGPTFLSRPPGVNFESVVTTEEMRESLFRKFSQATVVIMTAAVADFRPRTVSSSKIKKSGGEGLLLDLEKTPDILAELGKKKKDQILIGFAAETNLDTQMLQEKLFRKNLDLLVVNDVTRAGAGFDEDTNIVTFMDPSGNIEELPKMSKEKVAERILSRIDKMKR